MKLGILSIRRSLAGMLVASSLIGLAGGCTGPTKRGLEARERATHHFNSVRSRIDYDQAMQAFKRGQMIEAQRSLQKAMHSLPNESTHFVLLGRICFETSQLESAINAFERASEIDGALPAAGIDGHDVLHTSCRDEFFKRFLLFITKAGNGDYPILPADRFDLDGIEAVFAP